MPGASVRGWEIAYEQRGAGPDVLLVHGLLMDRTMFDPQVSALSDRYRFTLPDLRNHGESETRAEDFTQWDLMEDHVELLRSLGISSAVFGGVSQGGFQALRAAIAHPEMVDAVILINTQAGVEDPVKAQIYSTMAEVVAEEGFNDFILESTAAIIFGSSSDPDLRSVWMKRWANMEPKHLLHTLRAVNDRDDVTERLSEITVPALIIHGEEDAAIPMERAEALAEGLGGSVTLVRVPGAGHSSTIENPQPITDAIEKFLGEVTTSG